VKHLALLLLVSPILNASNVLDYGAVGDVLTITDAEMTSDSATLYSPNGLFTFEAVGKIVCVQGAGVSGLGLKSTISTFIDNQHVVLAAAASTSVSGQRAFWGTDDTKAIQNALDGAIGGEVIFPSRTYLVDPDMSLHPANGATLILQGTLKAIGTASGLNAVIDCSNRSDITIVGGVIEGDRYVHLGTTGEYGMGIMLESSLRIKVIGTTLRDCWGDGVWVGDATYKQDTPSRDITLQSILCDNNRRQGISVGSVIGLDVIGGVFTNTNGTAPSAGIDLEPDYPSNRLQNIRISGVSTSNNTGGGILIVPIRLADAPGGDVSITIDGWTSQDDGAATGTTGLHPGLRFAAGSGSALLNQLTGQISVTHARIINSFAMGVDFDNWSSLHPRVILEDAKVINPNRDGSGYADFGWTSHEDTMAANSAFVVSALPSDPYSATGWIDFRNCTAEDDRTVSTMQQAFYLHSSDPTKTINAIVQ